MDMIIAQNPPDVLTQVDAVLAASSNPWFFSDVLESWISDLVAARKWKVLVGLWKVVQARGPQDVEARLAYVLGRAGQEKMMALAAPLPG